MKSQLYTEEKKESLEFIDHQVNIIDRDLKNLREKIKFLLSIKKQYQIIKRELTK